MVHERILTSTRCLMIFFSKWNRSWSGGIRSDGTYDQCMSRDVFPFALGNSCFLEEWHNPGCLCSMCVGHANHRFSYSTPICLQEGNAWKWMSWKRTSGMHYLRWTRGSGIRHIGWWLVTLLLGRRLSGEVYMQLGSFSFDERLCGRCHSSSCSFKRAESQAERK